MTATTLVSLSTCGPLANESGCTPILVPECPSTGHRDFQFSVINGAKPDGCFSDLALSIEPTVNGGATVNWTATEKDPDSCMPVGSTITGSAVVPGACCSIQRDVRFPVSSFIFRLEVRTDWQ
jgi:hypothetical protein